MNLTLIDLNYNWVVRWSTVKCVLGLTLTVNVNLWVLIELFNCFFDNFRGSYKFRNKNKII